MKKCLYCPYKKVNGECEYSGLNADTYTICPNPKLRGKRIPARMKHIKRDKFGFINLDQEDKKQERTSDKLLALGVLTKFAEIMNPVLKEMIKQQDKELGNNKKRSKVVGSKKAHKTP